MKISNKMLILSSIGILVLLFIRGLYNSFKLFGNTDLGTEAITGEAIAGTLLWFGIIAFIASLVFLMIELVKKKQIVETKKSHMSSAILFGTSISSFVLFAIIAMMLGFSTLAKEQQTTASPKTSYTNQDNEEKAKEIDKLKGDIALLETQNNFLDAEVKKLKEELAKQEQQTQPAAKTVPQEQSKKDEPKPEVQQSTV
ncbi:hypothetical protein DJ93_5444 [Bacillus clarus]|uniref:Uncharacterized protein n=1 Tax=Bacillus clarus TaxID=2338372 RepID=A0A090YBZ4_9BACI|nr:hypothetical protein DJ93_5444 [Bacillus clarus]